MGVEKKKRDDHTNDPPRENISTLKTGAYFGFFPLFINREKTHGDVKKCTFRANLEKKNDYRQLSDCVMPRQAWDYSFLKRYNYCVIYHKDPENHNPDKKDRVKMKLYVYIPRRGTVEKDVKEVEFPPSMRVQEALESLRATYDLEDDSGSRGDFDQTRSPRNLIFYEYIRQNLSFR